MLPRYSSPALIIGVHSSAGAFVKSFKIPSICISEMPRRPKHYFRFGPFRLVTTERALLREGELVPLTPKVFDLLHEIVQHHGRVVAREEIMRTVWPDSFVEEGNLSVSIFMLRKALASGHAGPKYIETIPKRGYRFAGKVREFWEEGSSDSTVRSMAVLPFKSLGSDELGEYIGQGMADALITKLSAMRRLIVRPTSAVLKYTSFDSDPVAAGRGLKVGAVLEGSVQRLGERIRVTVQLVGVRSGAPLWAEKFDERFTDIFTVEDSISARVADALLFNLLIDEKRSLHKRHTENREAYQYYLQGRFHWNKRTGQGLRKSIECFRAAIERDPHYALAYAGLADSFAILAAYGALPPAEFAPGAKMAAQRALELDESLAEAHTSLAYVKFAYDWDWKGAEREFQRAMRLNPNYTTAYNWYSIYLMAKGRKEESLSTIRRAQEIDPISMPINAMAAWLLYFARDYDRAIKQCQEILDLEPNYMTAHYFLGCACLHMGAFEKATREFRRCDELSGVLPPSLAMIAHTAVKSGHRKKALAVLADLKERSAHGYVSPYLIASVCGAVGQHSEAFEWLKKACEIRDTWLFNAQVDPILDSVRTDPRYKNLLRHLRLLR